MNGLDSWVENLTPHILLRRIRSWWIPCSKAAGSAVGLWTSSSGGAIAGGDST